MYRYVLAEAPGGYEVYVNLIASSAGEYLSRRPHVLKLIREVLATIDLTKSRMTIERDMGRVIGNTDIVKTSETDNIFYARPLKKSVFSRFAKNRNPSPSRKLTIFFEQDTEGSYEILDIWIGPYTPPFPGDTKETTKSQVYWQEHALVEGAQTIQTKTITRECPY